MCLIGDHAHGRVGPDGVTRRKLLTGAAASALALGVGGCVSTNPATQRTSFTGIYSIEDDIKLGRESHPQMVTQFGGEYQHPRLNRYVTEIGNRLAANSEFQQFTWRFTIVNSPIVNAFATAGGYVYISRGLLALASNEAELAGVLAHEIGHITARHSAERMSAQQISQIGLVLGAIGLEAAGVPVGEDMMRLGQTFAAMAIQSYSREQEFESDTLGVRYMSRAGYDPDAMVSFLASLGEHSRLEAEMMGLPAGAVDEFNIMATHPRTADRVRRAQEAANTRRPVNARIGREDYLGRLDGLLFGDDPKEQGTIRDNQFVHAGMRFEFTVPKSYVLRNSPSAIMASYGQEGQILFDVGKYKRAREVGDYLQREWAGRARLNGFERITINGLPAATASTEAQGKRGRLILRLVAIDSGERSAFRFLIAAEPLHYDAFKDELRRATYSFRRITQAEADAVHAMRLLVIPAQANDTIAGLSRNMPYGRFNEAWFRVLNDLQQNQPITVNQRLKVIAA
jgi:predicted Zn-dependent protease